MTSFDIQNHKFFDPNAFVYSFSSEILALSHFEHMRDIKLNKADAIAIAEHFKITVIDETVSQDD